MSDNLWELFIKTLITILVTKAIEYVFVKTRDIRKSLEANLYFLAAVLVFSLSLFSFPLTLNKLPPLLFIPVYGAAFLVSFLFAFLYYRKVIIEKDLLNFKAQTRKKIKAVAASQALPEEVKQRKTQLYACTRVLRTVIHTIELEFNRNFKRGSFGNVSGSDEKNEFKDFKKFEGKLAAIYSEAITRIHETILGTENIPYVVYSDSGLLRKSVEDPLYRWLLDPIDGVYHFHHQIPFYTTSAALQVKTADRWETLLGVIYIPITREFFFAIRGEGAYLNDWNHILDISQPHPEKKDLLFHCEFPNTHSHKEEYKKACAFLEAVFCKVRRTRGLGLGSWGMAYAAKGAFDAYLTFSGSTQIYDIIAGKLLVECAGGKVLIASCKTEIPGTNPVPDLPGQVIAVASNESTYQQFKEELEILFTGLT